MIAIAVLRALFEKGEALACDVSLPSFFGNHGVQAILRLEKSVGERDQRPGLKIAFYEVAPAYGNPVPCGVQFSYGNRKWLI